MKNNEEEDDLLPEYDFSQMAGGVRGKYAAACREGTNLAQQEEQEWREEAVKARRVAQDRGIDQDAVDHAVDAARHGE